MKFNKFSYFSFISLINIFVFFPSLFHTPRSDQLLYFANMASDGNLLSLSFKNFALNRMTLPFPMPDELLYRPLTFLFLGVERILFDYNFVLWQLTGLLLHLIVLWFLLRLLLKIHEHLLALLWTLLFSVMLISVEMVIWQHVHSYLIFCILTLIALNIIHNATLNKTLSPKELSYLFVCLASSCFLFEFGVIVSILIAIYLLCVNSDNLRKSGLLLLIPSVFYCLMSFLDFTLRGLHLSNTSESIFRFGNIFPSLKNAFLAYKWWEFSGLFPTQLDTLPFGRTFISPQYIFNPGQFFNPLNILSLPVLAALILIGVLIYLIFYSVKTEHFKKHSFQTILLLAIVLCFGLLVSLGRVSQNGLVATLGSNSYYAYIYWLFLVPLVYYLIPFKHIESSKLVFSIKNILAGALVVLIITNGYLTFLFNAEKVKMDKPRREIVKQLKEVDSVTFTVGKGSRHVLLFNEMKNTKDYASKDCNYIQLLFPKRYTNSNPRYELSIKADGTWDTEDLK